MPSFLTINPFGLVHVHYCKNSNATNDYWNSIKFSLKFPNNLFISHADILINEEGQVSLFLAPSSGNCIHIYDINLDLYGPSKIIFKKFNP